jgi:hypothetical protein
MDDFEHAVVIAHFLAGNRIELTAIDAIPPNDPENGDAEFYRWRAINVAARKLKRGAPQAKIYILSE